MLPNEALAKAAEEARGKLALVSPLVVNLASQKHLGTAYRLDAYAVLLRDLANADERDAALGIGVGWMLRDNPAKLKTAMRMWGHIGGGIVDAHDYSSEIAKRFNVWWTQTTICRMIDARQCAIGICAEGRTFQELSWSHGFSDRAAKKKAIEGVRKYVDANRKREDYHPVHRMPVREVERAMMEVSRIVVFE